MTTPLHVWHPKKWCWKALRWSLALVIIYVVAEAWAQYRFGLSNPLMPSDMRKNIGVHTLDAFRLEANYDGWSQHGLHYRTNEFGFRIGEDHHKNAMANRVVLLGGDSRIFGYALDYSGTVSAQLEEDQDIYVHQQAFPGSSPAIFNVQIWTENLWDQLKPKPNAVIYGYDRDDIWNDNAFLREYQQAQTMTWHSPRVMKVALGGYLWNMANLKLKAFLSRCSWTPPWWEAWVASNPEPKPTPVSKTTPTEATTVQQPSGRSNPIGKKALLEMQRQCEQRGVPLTLMYLPRFLEIVYDDPKMRNELREFCAQEGIDFLDLYEVFSERCADNKSISSTWFLDPHEGIHFSEQGSAIISDAIAKHMGAKP